MLMFLFAWILFSIFFAEVLPDLIAGTVYVLIKLPRWLWRGSVKGYHMAASVVVFIWPYFRDGALFLFYVVSELTGLAPDNEELDDDEYQEEAENESGQDSYLAACERLGLKPPFTQSEFKTAYRRAMSAAHPDRGGTTQQAQVVNEARTRILDHASASN